MKRIIFVPQYPTPMRYQQWWERSFFDAFADIVPMSVTTLGGRDFLKTAFIRGRSELFSPVEQSIRWETSQIEEYMKLDLKDDDILFLSDISFPGIFCSALYHKRPKHMFAFCHATSLNKYDYFENVTHSKFPVETAHSTLFDTIFVGSNYHAEKLNWTNTKVTYLPNPPYQTFKEKKIYDIISVARPTKQKVDYKIEEKINKKFGEIKRIETNNWEDYYKFLSSSKVLLISSQEDTFNYTILEAINNNTIVLAPNRLCFPELLDNEYLYDNFEDLEIKLDKILNSETYLVPKLKCQKSVDNFFTDLVKYIIRS